jgi:eukaryotic-like serine/threonine-protein kinase
MTLTTGTKLGPYEILAPLGAGGMGEVYRARDTRLGREVAVKVLPRHLSTNPEVRMRFEREARTVSSLNHPGICVLHDVGREGDTDYLVMELVEGETLARRLEKGALPTPEVLRLGVQIADALDKAHRAGVVHRDLKPGNVMVTKAGAKLMDFGLARGAGLAGPEGASGVTMASLTQSPTVAQPLTAEGTLVGTFQYMAPEQLEGKEADTRSDIWALGCVLYEMATGKRAFEGKSQASLISAIMSGEPLPVSKIAPLSPPALDRVVAQCLAKDPDERFQRAHDVRLVLDSLRDASALLATAPAAAAKPRRRARLAVVLGLVLAAGVTIGVVSAKWLIPAPNVEPPRVRMLAHSGADEQPVPSPDGKTIAFVSSRAGVKQIWLKQLSSGDEVGLTPGEDTSPQFSPDGSQILFTRGGGSQVSLWRVSVVGGQSRRLVEDAVEGAWSPDGSRLAFLRAPSGQGLGGEVWVGDADGSEPRRVHRQAGGGLRWLSWSPNGRDLLVSPVPLANASIRYLIVSTEGDSARTVDPGGGLALTSNPVWLGSGDRIAYAIVEALATALIGQASRIVEQSLKTGEVRELLSLPSSCRDLAVLGPGRLLIGLAQESQNLVLVEEPGTPRTRERWLTRGGSLDRQPVFSPDGQRVMFSSNRSGNLDLWEMVVETGALSRLTDDPRQDWDPAYTHDGKGILWSSDRSGSFEVWRASADGTGARQLSHDGVDAENPGMTADGEWIVYLSGQPSRAGVWKMRADGSEAQPLVVNVNLPDVSPTEAFFAAPMGTGGRVNRALRVYRAGDGTPLPWEIVLPGTSSNSVGRPRWVGSRRLAYVDRDAAGRFGVTVRDVSETAVGPPQPLAGFDPLAPTESFAVSRDGGRVVLSVRNAVQSIAIAENVPGIDVSPKQVERR